MAVSSKDTKAVAYLNTCATQHSAHSRLFLDAADLYNKALYHELTAVLEAIFGLPDLQASQTLLGLYTEVVSVLAKRLNTQRVVFLAAVASKQIADATAAMSFLEEALKLAEGSPAVVIPYVAMADVKLRAGSGEECKAFLEKAEAVVNTLVEVDPILHSVFYKGAAAANAAHGEHAELYHNSLLYLACVDVESIGLSERVSLAHDMCVAALLARTVYNFGELLGHPILAALKGSTHEWLVPLVTAFNAGNISEFEALFAKHATKVAGEPLLAAERAFLEEKVSLLALVEMLFARPVHSREVSFAEVAAATRLPEASVERLVMRAMSLQLIKGHLDQVDAKVVATWVQPRVLSEDQLAVVGTRLKDWVAKVDSTLVVMEARTPELFA